MNIDLFSPGLIVLYIFILSGLYVHYRGKVRHNLLRQLTGASTITAPINCFMYSFSAVPNTPYLDTGQFPELKAFKDNWETIRDEAIHAYENGYVKSSDKLDDLGFNSFFRTGWKRFYLRWYGDFLPSATELCPETVKLIRQCPSIKAAMFTLLPPGGTLVRHRDPYAGSLRYHLGLSTPNSDDCFIRVDGEDYSWRDGEDVLFDETYIHHAQNDSDQQRLIFFADVERPMNNVIASWINRLFGRVVVAASASRNVDSEPVGFLNTLFHYVYQIRIAGKRLKAYNKRLYYALKYSLYVLLVYLIFF